MGAEGFADSDVPVPREATSGSDRSADLGVDGEALLGVGVAVRPADVAGDGGFLGGAGGMVAAGYCRRLSV
jgi:hypothetical protein